MFRRVADMLLTSLNHFLLFDSHRLHHEERTSFR
nr:MAG TPA: hypothetical protein [Caudoviricetes sp.]